MQEREGKETERGLGKRGVERARIEEEHGGV